MSCFDMAGWVCIPDRFKLVVYAVTYRDRHQSYVTLGALANQSPPSVDRPIHNCKVTPHLGAVSIILSWTSSLSPLSLRDRLHPVLLLIVRRVGIVSGRRLAVRHVLLSLRSDAGQRV